MTHQWRLDNDLESAMGAAAGDLHEHITDRIKGGMRGSTPNRVQRLHRSAGPNQLGRFQAGVPVFRMSLVKGPAQLRCR
jgi:hypothetical protein